MNLSQGRNPYIVRHEKKGDRIVGYVDLFEEKHGKHLKIGFILEKGSKKINAPLCKETENS